MFFLQMIIDALPTPHDRLVAERACVLRHVFDEEIRFPVKTRKAVVI